MNIYSLFVTIFVLSFQWFSRTYGRAGYCIRQVRRITIEERLLAFLKLVKYAVIKVHAFILSLHRDNYTSIIRLDY